MKLQSSQSTYEQIDDTADYCSTKKAATMLGVSHRTVQLWVESGVLVAWKTTGGHRRILLSSVDRLVDQRTQAIKTPDARKRTQKGFKILLVDDDATLLRLYELEIGGWDMPITVIKASNGFEALLKIGEAKPDLLVSDLTMPGMDGFRMIRTLRASRDYGNIAIIVISGLDRGTITSMGLPDDIPVFAKPVLFNELHKAVNEALQKAA